MEWNIYQCLTAEIWWKCFLVSFLSASKNKLSGNFGSESNLEIHIFGQRWERRWNVINFSVIKRKTKFTRKIKKLEKKGQTFLTKGVILRSILTIFISLVLCRKFKTEAERKDLTHFFLWIKTHLHDLPTNSSYEWG